MIQFSSEVRGITAISKEMFIVCAKLNEVQVYDIETSAFKMKFPVGGLHNPWSITANDNALFISETESGTIHRVEVPGKSTMKWTIGGSYGRLSITKQGSILVTNNNKLCEYTVDGILKRKIILDLEMRDLHHAIHLENDNFLISHVNGKMHRVCLVNTRGKLIRSYGGSSGFGKGQLYHPEQLIVDQNSHIFVPCFGDKRVVFLTSQLKFVKNVIPSSTNISCISTIYLDEYLGQLYVADSNNKTISVFKFI